MLSRVKAAADAGDYAAAKKELLIYYKKRYDDGTRLGFGVGKEDENYAAAVLPMRNILTGPNEFDTWQGEFYVSGGEFKPYEVDVTKRVQAELENGKVSFMLFAGEKRESGIYVKSKNSGSAPRLIIRYKHDERTITASESTYISLSQPRTAHDKENLLYVRETGGGGELKESERVYITFELEENMEILSAGLVLFAANERDKGERTVLVINTGDTVWHGSELTWESVRGSIYSYQNDSVPRFDVIPPNADSEYQNVISRFWFAKPMMYECLSYMSAPNAYESARGGQYNGADFAPKLIALMRAFTEQAEYGSPRTLETGERLNRWVDVVDELLAVSAFDGKEDDFFEIINFMRGDCEYINSLSIEDDSKWWSNWRVVANAGFFKAVEYLRELTAHDELRKKAEHNAEYSMNLLYNDDMSFAEAGFAYAEWCAKLFCDCVAAAENAGNPMKDEFLRKLSKAARYAAYSFFPNGCDSNVGDSNYRDKLSDFRAMARLTKDPVLTAYAEGDGEYRDNLTAFYKDANTAFVRTSWNAEDCVYAALINNPFDGHCHCDSNQLIMYAYGRPLLVDSGRYSYSTTNNIYSELRQSAAHNTVERVGCAMASHSVSADKTELLADNGLFTFVSSRQNGYDGAAHIRKVLFFKTDGLTVVFDFIDGEESGVYRQNWHFMPSSGAYAAGNTINTAFDGKSNISVVNADNDASTGLKSSFFSADYGLAAESRAAYFEKRGKKVKFSTVLKPLRAGESAKTRAADNSEDASESALYVEDEEKIHIYVRHTEKSDYKAERLCTDAAAAFIGETMYGTVGGSRLIDGSVTYIKADEKISLGVRIIGERAEIYTDERGARLIKSGKVNLYTANAKSVILNGEEILHLMRD